MNFLAGEGWQDSFGRPLVGWPPLFPLLLAAGGWVGIEPFAAGRLLNAAAFGLTILAAGNYLRSNLRSRGLALTASVVIATSLPLSYWASCIMTDSPLRPVDAPRLDPVGGLPPARRTDAPVGGRGFYRTGRADPLSGRGPDRRRRPVAAGAAHPAAGRPVERRHHLWDRLIHSLAGVLTRNWAISGYLTGWRDGSGQSLPAGLRQVADVFREWVIPSNAPDGFGYLLWTAVGLVAAAGLVVVLAGLGFGLGGKDRTAPPLFGLGPALPFGVFTLIYSLFMVAVVPFTAAQEINSRYLLPVYVPLLLAAVLLLDRFLSHRGGGLVAAKWVWRPLSCWGSLPTPALGA